MMAEGMEFLFLSIILKYKMIIPRKIINSLIVEVCKQ